jgi:hypothetical protein
MFKVKNKDYLKDMGFVLEGDDYVCRKELEDRFAILFKIYKGSLYIRCYRTSTVVQHQLRCIYEWAVKGYIEWEE